MAARTSRCIGVVLAASALVAGAAAPSAAQTAAGTGSGYSSGEVSLLSVSLGDDGLIAGLVAEGSHTSNDPSTGGPSAIERVTLLGLSSTLVPGLSALSQPAVETRHPSGPEAAVTPALDLGALVAGGAAPGLLAGTVDPVALRSTFDGADAISSATGAVRDLSVLGGFLSVDLAGAELGSAALTSAAGAERHLQVDRVVALDLGALLEALGITLGDLPIDVAVDLLAALGVPLPGDLTPQALLDQIDGLLDDTSVVRGQVALLQANIDGLQDDLAALQSQADQASEDLDAAIDQLAIDQALLDACLVACEVLQAIVDARQAEVDAATAVLAALNGAIDATQAQIDDLIDQIAALLATISAAADELTGLLEDLLVSLGAAPLLVLEDLDVGLVAWAAGSIADSTAAVVASLGDLRVGSTSLGGVDADATLTELAALDDAVNDALGEVLALIDPSLTAVVDVQLLERFASVDDGPAGVTAAATFAGLRVTVTPPSPCALLASVTDVENLLATVLDDLDAALPDLPTPVRDVLGQLGSSADCSEAGDGVVSALTQPLRLEALSVAGAGVFRADGSDPGGSAPPIPRTGHVAPLALAVVLGGLGLSARWLVRRSV